MVSVRLPKLGAGMESATIVAWLKKDGDPVEEGEPLLQVETDKAVEEVAAPATGRPLRKLCAVGNKVEAGQALAEIG